MTRVRVIPMALALGATWGLGIMLLGWVSATGWGTRLVYVLSGLYVGYASTFLGGVIGGLWAFSDAFLAGLLLTFFYNALTGEKRSEQVHLGQTEQPAH